MGGGDQTSTTQSQQTTQLPPWINTAAQQNYGFAQNVATQPLQQYQGQMVADVAPQTQQACNTAASGGNGGQQQYDAAQAGYLGVMGQQPQQVTAPTSSQLAGYMNPYTQSVINATLPIMFDFSPFPGDPDIASASSGPGPLCADTEAATYAASGGTVTAGGWSSLPSECGPYPTGATPGTLNYVNMTAQTRQFDSTVTSNTGDFWLASTNPSTPFSPIVINPGATGTINVTITPSGPKNTKVSGTLYVDDYVQGVPPYGQIAGDELAGLPYAYMIK